MPSKTLKKPVKKAAVAKKTVAKKPISKKVTSSRSAPAKPKAAASKAKTAVKKPVVKKAPAKKVTAKAPVKKVAVKKAPVKKVIAKKTSTAKKPVLKKTAAKKSAAKKPVVKKAVAKAPAKKIAKKPVKKVVASKAAPKKAPVKKPAVKTVAKKTPVKAVVKKPVAQKTVAKQAPKAVEKSTPKKTQAPALKKPLATLDKTEVKPSAIVKAREITPIKAPVPVVAKPKPEKDSNTDMTAITVPQDYEPTDTEEFMSPVMKEYFRQRLFAWRDELLRESEETLTTLHEEGNMQKPDITDRASEETDLAIEFRTRDRERKLLNKINEAILRIEDNSYGYCEETGDAIPVKRLIARPTAIRTLEAEELHERRERTQRDQYE